MFASPPPSALRHPPRVPRPTPVPRVGGAALPLPGPGAATEDFWAEVARRGTPVVGPDPLGDPAHRGVTFLWRGGPGTRAVQAVPNKLADPHDPRATLMERVPDTDVWHVTLRLGADWQGTYDLLVDEGGGPASGSPEYAAWLRTRRRADPFNSRTLPRRWGGEPLHWAALPQAPAQDAWSLPCPAGERGTLSAHAVPSARLGGTRRTWLYTPADADGVVAGPANGGGTALPGSGRGAALPGSGRGAALPGSGLPLLVLLDGEHWGPVLGVAGLLDGLIAAGLVPPMAALLPDSVDADTRWAELTCRPEYLAFLTEDLIPWAAARLPLTTDPAHTVIAGQSLGGLTAAWAALAAPHRFGNVLAQSGSFWWPNGPDAEWLTRTIASAPRRPVRFRLSFGHQEWVALPAARRLRTALAEAGYEDAEYHEFNGGHDYLCWRTELAAGLPELVPGPVASEPVASEPVASEPVASGGEARAAEAANAGLPGAAAHARTAPGAAL
ncbi:enterochelin esterase domain-containing protein [Streptomyces evansiae]|uniref:enterochelin esterase domain-containing protein n=1 Tax=Streptomyces evansiae TaxID=3075535 RepID=UPI00288858A2|nr:alpha/beta hydrolase-fold protein [Streptomyces sp. DSM 41859]MDT0423945.1 alpha/beta hydrolase-fold protein [Streptomyces sp. DSM 41859]